MHAYLVSPPPLVWLGSGGGAAADAAIIIIITHQNCSGTAPPSGLTSPQCPVDVPVLPPHRSGQLYSKYPSW